MPLDLSSFLLRPRPAFVWREIHWPAELDPEVALAVLRQLATDHFVRFVAFEVEASAGPVVHRIGVPAEAVERVEQLLTTLVPNSALTITGARTEFADAWRVAVNTQHRPLQVSNPEQIARAVLAALTAAKKNERIVVQWLLGRTHAPRPVAAAEPSSTVEPWWRPLVGGGDAQLDAERRHALQTKRSDHAFACVGRVAISAGTPGRTRALAVGVLAGLRIAEAPGIGIKLLKERSDRFNSVAVPWRWPYVLNVSELVGLLGWPLGDQPLPGIPRDASRWLRPDPRIKPHRRVLGEATAPGEDRQLGLSIDDARQHLHVIGPTGTGKSTLLANLICQDIAAGRGVVVIEPKGDLVDDVLARIPHERIEDVVVLDPTESEYPIGLNPLLGRDRRPELVADQVLAVFHGLYERTGDRGCRTSSTPAC